MKYYHYRAVSISLINIRFFILLYVFITMLVSSTVIAAEIRVEDRAAHLYNISTTINLPKKEGVRLLLNFEYNQTQGSSEDTRGFIFPDTEGSGEDTFEDLSATHDLNVQSFRGSFGFKVLNYKRVSLTVSPGLQWTTVKRTTKVDDLTLINHDDNPRPGVRISAASQVYKHLTFKGFGSIHYQSREAGLLIAVHTFEWLDVELGWRMLDYLDSSSSFKFQDTIDCPQVEREDYIGCVYDFSKVEAVLSGFSAGLHLKF